MTTLEIVLQALRRPLDPMPDPINLDSHHYTALFGLLHTLFRRGDHLRDDLGWETPWARKRLVAFLAAADRRIGGMAGSGKLSWATQQFLLAHPVLFEPHAMAQLLRHYDELCDGYPLAAPAARTFFHRSLKSATYHLGVAADYNDLIDNTIGGACLV